MNNAQLHGAVSFVHVSGATDLELIIYIFPQSTLNPPTTTHTPLTYTVWYTGALSSLRHTPVPRRVMSLSSHLLSRESFWACCQGNLALHSMDTPTHPICLNTSPLLALPFLVPGLFKSPLPSFFFLPSVFLNLSPYFFFSFHWFSLFLEAELVQDFHSWLADLKLELKDCSNQSGDVVILGAKLQRLKVQLYHTLTYPYWWCSCCGTMVNQRHIQLCWFPQINASS